MATPNELDILVAGTIEDWINGGELEDVVFTQTAVLNWILNNCIERKASGPTVQGNIEISRNRNFTGYGRYQSFEFRPLPGAVRTTWDRKEHVMPLGISAQEEEYNTGEGELFDVVKRAVDNTVKSLNQDLEHLFINSDGSDPLESNGFELIFGDSQSPNPEVGGIDSRDYPWWQSIVKRPGDTFPTIDWDNIDTAWTYGTDPITVQNPYDSNDVDPWQPLTLDLLDEYIDLADISDPAEKRVCITTPALKRALIRLMKAESVTVSSDKTGKLVGGHDNVEYRNLTVVSSHKMPNGRMLFPSSRSLKVRVHPNKWLKTRPWMTPYNQDAKYMVIFAWCQMYCTDRRALGMFTKVSHK